MTNNQRKPGGRPPTPAPGANLTARLERNEQAIQRIEGQIGDILEAVRQIAVQGQQQQVQPQFAPTVPQMTEQEAQRFGQELESSVQTAQMQQAQMDQGLLAKLARERKVRIYVDDPDVFIYAGERWPFVDLGYFDVPETIGRMYMQRKRERQQLQRVEHTLGSRLASRPLHRDELEPMIEQMLGNKPSRATGRANGLIQRSNS